MSQTVQLGNGLSSSIRPGEVLGGKYRLERELGRGAMGTVWAAMHLTLGQRVAIKIIAAEHAQSPEARQRFSTEAKAAARLRSRHVVQVYDDGATPEGTPYIVMEYLEGESLEGRLDREHDIPLVDAVRVTGHVARALARAHAQGIVHRDLKPGNIFLARSDEEELGWLSKVLDFGIAKVEEHREQSTTKTGTVLGTPLFMSPEQVRGASNVDHRADLYSLGMCFYNMLTGKFAFDGDSFGDILVSICTEPLPDIRESLPWLPEAVGAWFQRCCAREAAARFQSADELVEALQAAVGSNFQVLSRRSVPEEQRGPSGTIKGHSPPLSPNTVPLGAEDSGAYTLRQSIDQALQTPSSGKREITSSEAASVLTVHDAPDSERKSGSRRGIAIAAVVALAIVGGVAVFVGQSSGDTASGSGAAADPGSPPAPSSLPLAPKPELAEAPPPAPALAKPAEPEVNAPAAPAIDEPASKPPPAAAISKPASARPKARPKPKPKSNETDLGF